jgi:hypothetical protein
MREAAIAFVWFSASSVLINALWFTVFVVLRKARVDSAEKRSACESPEEESAWQAYARDPAGRLLFGLLALSLALPLVALAAYLIWNTLLLLVVSQG